MEEPNPPIAVPTTIEGIAIHLGYINRSLNDLNKKMDAVSSSTVNRQEWSDHLKRDEDHEARIRVLEKSVEDLKGSIKTLSATISTTVKVWGTALGVGLTIVEILSRFIIK